MSSIYDRLFGAEAGGPCQDFAVPSLGTAPELGKVRVRRCPGRVRVWLSVLAEPRGAEAERWQTGVALDASGSMREGYGRVYLGRVPDEARRGYAAKGWVECREQDGRGYWFYHRAALEDAVARGFVRFSPNRVEPVARRFIHYLARELDSRGGTSVIYWGGGGGDGVEPLGDVTAGQALTLSVGGPRGDFGDRTRLAPALRYFTSRSEAAPRSMFVFLTDGRIDDLGEVKAETVALARRIAEGRRNLVKCVLIGVGPGIDEAQLCELDDLDTGTDVDVWDHKVADEMRFVVEIFAELAGTDRPVAPSGAVYDGRGVCVWRTTDGVPARLAFDLPADADAFELQIHGRRIRQSVLPPRQPEPEGPP